MKRSKVLFLACLAAGAGTAQPIELIPVVSKPIARTVDLPAEFQAFQTVSIHAKVAGFVERVLVDRGSVVKTGQLLAELSAPEFKARIAEAEARVQFAASERVQAEAQLAGLQSTADRMKKAAETPGAIAGNELVQAQKHVEAAQALLQARQQASHAAEASLLAQRDFESYLRVTAPFDGVVTDRMIHTGALVGTGTDAAMLIIQDISHLRLTVAVPEENVGGIIQGAKVSFKVPAFPEVSYTGTVARISHLLDPRTRSMPVELDVQNPNLALSPGMYPMVKWPVRRPGAALIVPTTSIVSTSERTFVVRSNDGKAEWVNVSKGFADGDSVEVSGNLKVGDKIVRRASDEMREGMALK